jgi:hypothetical protein
VCYRDFRHWEKSYQHMCSADTITFHVLISSFSQLAISTNFFFWIWVKCLYNKQNNTWTLGDMNLSSSVHQAWYLTSERSECFIFYIFYTDKQRAQPFFRQASEREYDRFERKVCRIWMLLFVITCSYSYYRVPIINQL